MDGYGVVGGRRWGRGDRNGNGGNGGNSRPRRDIDDMTNIVCPGPGPHIPSDGILGTTDGVDVGGHYCPPCAAKVFGPAQAAAAAAQAAVTDAKASLQKLLAEQDAMVQQIQGDAAMFAATPIGSTIQAEHIAAFGRMVAGFGTVMGAIADHLTVTGIT